MENKQPSAFASSISPGIIIGAVLIVFSLILFLLDVDHESFLNYISYALLAVGLWWAINSYKKKLDGGFISYGTAFSAGFYAGLVASVIVAIYLYFYVLKINPGMIDEILLKAEEQMLDRNPDMTDEQIEQGLSLIQKIYSPGMFSVFGFIINVIASALISLIIAIFAKRENTGFNSAE